MEYWLYTDDYPGDGFEQWAIYTTDHIFLDKRDDLDKAVVKEVIIDKWNNLEIDDIKPFYDDAMTNDPHRVIKFLFDQVFYQ